MKRFLLFAFALLGAGSWAHGAITGYVQINPPGGKQVGKVNVSTAAATYVCFDDGSCQTTAAAGAGSPITTFNVITGTVTTRLALPYITPGTVLAVDANGVIVSTTVTGGGSNIVSSASGTVNTGGQFSVPYYSVPGSSNVVSAFPGVTLSTNTGVVISTISISSATLQASLHMNSGTNINYGTTSPGTIFDIRGTAANGDPTPMAYYQYSGAGTALQASADNLSPAAIFFNNSSGDGMKASKIGGTGAAAEFTTDSSTAIYAHVVNGTGMLVTTTGGTPAIIQGPGDGQITLTVGNSTATVTYSSTTTSWTIGHGLVITSTSGALGDSGATPGSGGSGASTINSGLSGQLASYTLNGTSISAVSNTNVWASSVTVSTFGVVIGATKTSNLGFNGTGGAGALDVWMTGAATNKTLFDIGSSALADQFYIPNNHYVEATLGLQAGQLVVGDTGASGQRIYSSGDISSFFDLRNGSTATINTGTANGRGDIRLQPAGALDLTVSNAVTTGVTASSMTVQGYFQMPIRTKAQIGATTPTTTDGNVSALGEAYYCSDCATVAVCVSTGTAQGAFALITNKGSACN